MSDKVTELGGITIVPMTVEKVLTNSIPEIPERAMVIGWDKDDNLYLAGTHSDMEGALMLLEMAKRHVMEFMWANHSG